ncbi:MAG: DNA/RNA nuclease SfsA [Denitrovibrio sp.]|nr:MAG: DNA/RNA nuclease SfsA [Denitrovibrio sp.]
MYKYPKLLKAKFIKRYKRFFTDVEINGKILTVHNPNTGSMKKVIKEGRDVLISLSENPKRKLAHTLEAFFVDGEWMLTNTILMNKVAQAAVMDGEIPELGLVTDIRREFTYMDGRIDLLVQCGLGKCLIEVKNVTLFDEEYCMFPDAVTERGRKHLNMLMRSLDEGYTPCMLYMCQISKPFFRPAYEIDPKYAVALKEAVQKGVKVFTMNTVFNEADLTVRLEKGPELKL